VIKPKVPQNVNANAQIATPLPVNSRRVSNSMPKGEKSDVSSTSGTDQNVDGRRTANRLSTRSNVRAGEHEKSFIRNPSSEKLIPNNKKSVNMSFDAEKSNMSGKDLTLSDVKVNDETTDSMADTRSLQRMMTNRSMKSANVDVIAEEEETPRSNNQRQPTVMSMGEEISDQVESEPSKTTKTPTVATIPNNKLKSKHSSDNEENSMTNDETDQLLDNENVAETVANGNSDDDDWDSKPPAKAKVLPKAAPLAPIVTNKLPTTRASVPKIPSKSDGKPPIKIQKQKTGLTSKENTKDLSINSSEKEKSMNLTKSRSSTRSSFSYEEGKRSPVDADGVPLSALALKNNIGAVLSDERPASALSSSSQKPRPIMSRRNTEHTIVDLSKIANVPGASQQSDDVQIHNPYVISSIANYESVMLSTDTKVADQTDAPIEFYKKMKMITKDDSKTTDPMATDGKSDEIPGDEFTSFLNKTTVSKFDGENLDVTTNNQSTGDVAVENETLGPLFAYTKRSPIHTAGRRSRQPSFIDNAHVIQINSSKESHMRALPSEKFWRRNQRRVSRMPGAEESQAAQK
jgi:hypothetical protein